MGTVNEIAGEIWNIWQQYSDEERRKIAHAKRFLECHSGDDEFRAMLHGNPGDAKKYLVEHGCLVDPDEMRPLWDNPGEAFQIDGQMENWPTVKLWHEYLAARVALRGELVAAGDPGEFNPHFSTWRSFQLSRLSLETADTSASNVHPIAAFELSDGCTMGCWFCGVAADRFEGSLSFSTENTALWRGVLNVLKKKFGPAAQSSFCYWGTDPMDNQDYLNFLDVFYDVIGTVPQTTTAAPMRNPRRIRDILENTTRRYGMVNRFSILTRQILRRVFKEYSAQDLEHVELVFQNKEALSTKKLSGAAFTPRSNVSSELRSSMSVGTIACVTGFLVNLVKRRVMLITPTLANEIWPKGYRILKEATFTDVDNFEQLIDHMLRNEVHSTLRGNDVIKLNDHLAVEQSDPNIKIKGRRHEIEIEGRFRSTINLIASGQHSLGTIVASAPQDVLPTEVIGLVNHCYQQGYIERSL